MRARLMTVVAGAVLLLAPAAALSQSADDGPIATSPDAPRNTAPLPPEQPDQPPPAPAAYAPPPESPPALPPPPAAEAPPAAAYAAPQAAAPPPQAASAPAAAVAYAVSPHRVSFLADTASKDAMAGALSFAGAAVAINTEMRAGDKLVGADAIDDPATAIAQTVARDYAAELGGAAADAPTDWDGAGAGWARYLVKVATTEWGFTYYPLDWKHYHLTYEAKLELVDVVAKRVVAKATCSHKSDAASEHYSYDDLTGAGGATLKSQLHAIADECAAQFKAGMAKS
jgi:hypothetical protein